MVVVEAGDEVRSRVCLCIVWIESIWVDGWGWVVVEAGDKVCMNKPTARFPRVAQPIHGSGIPPTDRPTDDT